MKQGVGAMLRKPLFFLLAFLLGPALVGWFVPQAEAATLLYSNSFESGLGDVQKQMRCHPYTYTIVTSRVRSGSKAVRHIMKGREGCVESDGVKRHRALLRHGFDSKLKFKPKTPYWFGFSLFVPNNYPTGGTDAIIAFGLMSSFPGETAAFIRGGKLDFLRRWNDGQLNEVREARVPIQTGKWMDVVMNLKRSWQSDGVLRVWVNGELIVNTTGINATNYAARGSGDPYFRTGIYWGNKTRDATYTLYYDSIKIAEGTDGYDLVAPSGLVSGAPAAPTGLSVGVGVAEQAQPLK